MFSTMMIEPFAILPMAMAMPPMDITVRAMPKQSIRIRAISTENGMITEAIRALRRSPMKTSITSTISPAPSSMEISTCSSDFRISFD